MAFTQHKKNDIVWMESSNIKAKHAFSTRYGGVSKGMWESLNLGENRGDKPEAVNANFCRICGACGFPL